MIITVKKMYSFFDSNLNVTTIRYVTVIEFLEG
jgi:hypothetical protein